MFTPSPTSPEWFCPKCGRRKQRQFASCRQCALDTVTGQKYADVMAFRKQFGIHPAHVHAGRFDRFCKQRRKKEGK